MNIQQNKLSRNINKNDSRLISDYHHFELFMKCNTRTGRLKSPAQYRRTKPPQSHDF
jgi:hypothetical protein